VKKSIRGARLANSSAIGDHRLARLKKRLNPVAPPLVDVIAPRGVVGAAAAEDEDEDEVGLTATDFLNEVRTDRRSGSLVARRTVWAGETGSTEGELRLVPELAPLSSKRICRCSPTEQATVVVIVVLCCFGCASCANRGPASENIRR
jgi:hypothetical protein